MRGSGRASSKTLMYNEQSDSSSEVSSDENSVQDCLPCEVSASGIDSFMSPQEEWRDARSTITAHPPEWSQTLMQSPVAPSAESEVADTDLLDMRDKKERRRVKKDKKVIFNEDSLFNQTFNSSPWVQMEPSTADPKPMWVSESPMPTRDCQTGSVSLPPDGTLPWRGLSDCPTPVETDIHQGGLVSHAVPAAASSPQEAMPGMCAIDGALTEDDTTPLQILAPIHATSCDRVAPEVNNDTGPAVCEPELPTVLAMPVHSDTPVDPDVVLVPSSNVFVHEYGISAVHQPASIEVIIDDQKEAPSNLPREESARSPNLVPDSPSIALLFRCLLELPAEQINATLSQARVARPELNDERWIEEKMLSWGRTITREVREDLNSERLSVAETSRISDLTAIVRDLKSHQKHAMRDWRSIMNEQLKMRSVREPSYRSDSASESHESMSVASYLGAEYSSSEATKKIPKLKLPKKHALGERQPENAPGMQNYGHPSHASYPPLGVRPVGEPILQEIHQPQTMMPVPQQTQQDILRYQQHIRCEQMRQQPYPQQPLQQELYQSGLQQAYPQQPLQPVYYQSSPQHPYLQQPLQPMYYQSSAQQPYLQQPPYQQSGRHYPQPLQPEGTSLPVHPQQIPQWQQHNRQHRQTAVSSDGIPQNFSSQRPLTNSASMESEPSLVRRHSQGQPQPLQPPTLQTRQAFSSQPYALSTSISLLPQPSRDDTFSSMMSPVPPAASSEMEGNAAPVSVSVKLTPAQERAFSDVHLIDSFVGLQDFVNKNALEDDDLFVSDTENGDAQADVLPDYNPVTGLPWVRR